MERLAEAEKLNTAGDKDGAIKIYTELLENDADQVVFESAAYAKVNLLNAHKDFEQAAATASDALAKLKDKSTELAVGIRVERCLAFINSRNGAALVDEVEFLEAESSGSNPNAAMLLGTAANEAANELAKSNPTRALAFYDKALKSTDIATDPIHFNRATCLARLGRTDDAIESLEKFLEGSPTSKEALRFLGSLKMKKKDYEGAVETLKKLPDDAAVCFQRANALILLVRFPEAKAMLKRVLELEPGHEGAANTLASLTATAVSFAEKMSPEETARIQTAAAKAKEIATTSKLTEKKIEKMVRRKSIGEDEYARPERPVTPPPEMDAPLEVTPPELLGAPNSLGLPTVSLADIVARKNLPADFDVANTEKYLTDEEFFATFGMDYKTFSAMKKWKRNREKKKFGLF